MGEFWIYSIENIEHPGYFRSFQVNNIIFHNQKKYFDAKKYIRLENVSRNLFKTQCSFQPIKWTCQ